MIIKYNGEYLEFNEDVQVEVQLKSIANLENAGDFSYEFNIPNTSVNRRILSIESINSINKTIYLQNECIIENEDGIPIYIGRLMIQGIDDEQLISASFFSGNTNWFNQVTDNINQIDMSAHKIGAPITDPSSIIPDSWSNDEWITFPLINKGLLTNWSIPRLATINFMPFVYIKNIFKSVFQYCGLKVNGELLDDGLFNSIIVGTNSLSAQIVHLNDRQFFVGKDTPQAIGTTPVVVEFPVYSFPYFRDKLTNWDGDTYTSDIKIWSTVQVLLNLDANVKFTLEILVDGGVIDSMTKTGTKISYDFQKNAKYTVSPVISLAEGGTLSIRVSIDSGTANITDGWLKFSVLRLLDTYPQFLLADMSQRDFIMAVFNMFNVITKYDPYTKTVTCNLFNQIKNKEEQDLSEYVTSYRIDYVKALEDYAKRNIFTYQQNENENIENYNNQSEIDYGSGVVEPLNSFVSGDKTIDLPFMNSSFEYSNVFQSSLMNVGLDDISTDGEEFEIVTVTDSSGIAHFETSEDHGFEVLDYVWITDTSTGDYVGIGRIQGIDSPNEFEIFNLQFTEDVTGNVIKVSYSENITDDVFLAVNIPNMLVSDFSNLDTFEYGGVDYSNIAYAFFLKNVTGRPIDSYIQSPAFDDPEMEGYNNNTLLEAYYSVLKNIVNDPVTVFAKMVIPLHVFRNLDLTSPIRLKTKDFNELFYCEKITGYVNSYTECEVQLVKL